MSSSSPVTRFGEPRGKIQVGWLLAVAMLGCTQHPLPVGVVRFEPVNFPKTVQGPMPGFGPFESYREALAAACPLMLTQRDASAGREGSVGFESRWRTATEYCAWLYYTPDGKYELSMIVESAEAIPHRNYEARRCKAPALVDDKRFPARSLKYVYFVHSHPSVPTNLSEEDIGLVVKIAKIHGKFVETAEGRIPVGVVAFFSKSSLPAADSCDGFYEYTWGSDEVVRWTMDGQGQWRRSKAGAVNWVGETEFTFEPVR